MKRRTRKASEIQDLLLHLEHLRSEMLTLVNENRPIVSDVHPDNRTSAVNLLHYLALRGHDIRGLQERLAALGLSSLGRTEAHVLSAIRTVMNALAKLGGAGRASAEAGDTAYPEVACPREEGRRLLDRNTDTLLGSAPENRNVRIMVTVPSDAATDYDLIRGLLAGGMNCMRINCAHDNPEAWSGMIRNLRKAELETRRRCRIQMDLAGPKMRTGPVAPGPAVIKYRPKRDVYGRVKHPARIWLTPIGQPEDPPSPADACLTVPAKWLSVLKTGEVVRFHDARNKSRSMTVRGKIGHSRWAEGRQTAYLTPDTWISMAKTKPARVRRARVGPLAAQPGSIPLKAGDHLVLTRQLQPGRPAEFNEKDELISPARIEVTLPEFFDCIRAGEPVWLDDGKFGGVVSAVESNQVVVHLTQAPPKGAKLGAEKGINAPDTDLKTPALTKDDLQALEFIVKNADIVGYSFVRTEQDVRDLQNRLAALGAENLGIVLKIETRQGFENLPRLLLAALRSRSIGVMIARGDLAVECGYQRLAEAQEEILWISEAAHVPVVWATQVLETLAKTGMPSRSEITDAAMGERAECVMLNKGPYVVDAVKTLDDILSRMQAHQEKKRSKLRKLRLASGFVEKAHGGASAKRRVATRPP